MARLLKKDGFEKIIDLPDTAPPPLYYKIANTPMIKYIPDVDEGVAPTMDVTMSEMTFRLDQGQMGILTYLEQ